MRPSASHSPISSAEGDSHAEQPERTRMIARTNTIIGFSMHLMMDCIIHMAYLSVKWSTEAGQDTFLALTGRFADEVTYLRQDDFVHR